LADAVGDFAFRTPAVALAQARAAASAPTFDYVIDAPSRTVGGHEATLHGAELPYLFESEETDSGRRLIGEQPIPEMGERLRSLWLRFVRCGDPTADASVWPRYGTVGPVTALVSQDGVVAVADLDAARRILWS
jgi:para-nitrobenzyl esterase